MLLQASLLAAICSPQAAPPPAEVDVDPGTREQIRVAINSARLTERLHRGVDGDTAWFRGADYKAFAHKEGFTYVPFFGSTAPRNFPVHIRLTGARNGEQDLALARGALRTFDGNAEIDRGPVTMRYRLAEDEAEQLVVFDGMGEVLGDVEFSVEYTSDLELVRDQDGLRLLGEFGEVRVGGAIALDGRGGSLALELTVVGSSATYRIPEWFARAAGNGLVVDPLITTVVAVDELPNLREPDVAFDSNANTYCIAMTAAFSSGDNDIFTATLDGSTLAVVNDSFAEASSFNARRPRICSLPGPGRYIVAYLKEDQFDRPEIMLRARNSTPGGIWEPEQVGWSFDEFYEPHNHDIGGELFAGADPFAMLTWRSNGRGAVPVPSRIRARRISGGGNGIGGQIAITPFSATLNHGTPAISKYAGDPGFHNAWWITYPAGPLGSGLNELRAARVSFSGTITESDRRVFQVTAGATLGAVDVSAPYRTTDVTEAVHFTASVVVGGAPETFVATHQRSSVGTAVPAEVMGDVDIHDSAVNSSGAICTFMDRAVISYNDRVQASNPTAILASTIERERGGGAAVGERRVFIDTLNSFGSTTPSLVSSYAGGLPQASDRALAVWPSGGAVNLDIFAALLSFPEPRAIGETFCVGTRNTSGELGFLRAFGDNSIGAPKTLRATQLPPNQFGFFVVSQSTGSSFPANSIGRLCLAGAIGRYNASVLNSGAAGEFDLMIDPASIPLGSGITSAAPGETWSFQAWHRDFVLGPTSNFTSGVRITF